MLAFGTELPPTHPEPQILPEIEVPAGWLRLGLQAGEPDFFEKLLAHLIEQSGATAGGLWLIVRTAKGNGLAWKAGRDLPHDDPAWTAWIRERVRDLVASRKPLRLPHGPNGAPSDPCIFVPLVWERAGLGVVLLSGPDLSVPAVARLGTLAGWATRLHVRQPHTPSGTMDQACADALLASAHSADWPGILAAHFRRQSGAWRASLLRERQDRWRMIAVSGVREVKRRTAESRAIEDAFAWLSVPQPVAKGSAPGERTMLALRFEKASGWGLLLEFEKGAANDEAHVRHGLAGLLQVGERVLPQVHEPGWRLSVARRLLDPSSATGPRGSRWVLAGLGVVALVAAFFPVSETFDGECELQPAQRFTVVSEVEGRVKTISAQEGALVRTGETLAELDASTLKTRLEVVRELREEQEAQARRHQGLQDMTSYRLAKLKSEQHAQEETSLLEDIRRSTIVAPIDGKVLTKDLAQKQGTVLRLGDTLCEVGALNAWNLQIALPEEDLDTFLHALARRGSLPVSYRLKAGSTVRLSAEVKSAQQVSQMAYPVEGRNVVYVTAPGVAIPEELVRELRPGFSGRAKIEGARRPWAAILTRRVVQFVRLHWWL